MCGRDAAFYTWAEIHAFSQPLGFILPEEEIAPVYNRAPTHRAWVITADENSDGAAHPMRWGLIPFWAKDGKIAYTTINARVETAAEKPAFREAWKRRRCLVPSSGYYEWKVLPDGKSKQPYFIHDAHRPVFLFGGLWERWQGPDGQAIDTYSIVTQEAAGAVTQVHTRMPLILPPDLLRDWLRGSANDAAAIAQAAPVPDFAFHPVGTAVGNVRNEGPGLIEPVSAARGALL